MSGNSNLNTAKKAKYNEFYTQYSDIENEINTYVSYNPDLFRGKTILLPCDDPNYSNFTRYFVANFERFGIKKLISTSYAKSPLNSRITPSDVHGKLFVLEAGSLPVDIDNLQFSYLEGDGDFRSEEVTKFRCEADMVITNPPFSLFREFLAWIMEDEKQFLIIGNKNAIGYKEVFPLLKNNKIWLGCKSPKEFSQPDGSVKKFGNIDWFTNINHGKRHKTLRLNTKAYNLKHNKKLKKKLNTYNVSDYPKYDNYNAIEVPFTECIPSDYDGAMGVPITFLDKYNPDQFEILGLTTGRKEFDALAYPLKYYENAIQHNKDGFIANGSKVNTMAVIRNDNPSGVYYTADNMDGFLEGFYTRILIRHNNNSIHNKN